MECFIYKFTKIIFDTRSRPMTENFNYLFQLFNYLFQLFILSYTCSG